MDTNHPELNKDEAMDIMEGEGHPEDDDNIPMEDLEFDNQIDFEKATVENV